MTAHTHVKTNGKRTVLVPQAIAPHRELLRRRGVEVARGEAAEPAVPKAGVALLVDEVFEVEAELADALVVLGLEAEVEERVVERAAHEELEREVVRALGRLARVVELRLVPVHLPVMVRTWTPGVRSQESGDGEMGRWGWAGCVRDATYEEVVAHGERGGLVGPDVVEVVRLAGEGGVDMVDDGLGDLRHVCRTGGQRENGRGRSTNVEAARNGASDSLSARGS